MKKLTQILISSALVGFVLQVIATNFAYAATQADCLRLSGADSVLSIMNACSGCGGDGDITRRGTLWFNSGEAGKNSNIVRTNGVTSGSIPIKLWGQVYACANTNTSAMNAYSIWFGEAGRMLTTDTHLDFISVPSPLARGSTSGKYTWSSGGSTTGTLNIDRFRQVASCHSIGEGMEECRYVVSVNRCSTNRTYANATNDHNPGTGCYGDDSEIILIIEEGADSSPADSYFESRSSVHIPAQNGDVDNHEKTSVWDGTTGVLLSTDSGSLDVEFYHQIHYVNGKTPHDYNCGEDHDHIDSASTSWEITGTGDMSSSDGSGTFTTPGGAPAETGELPGTRITKHITLEKGETKTVCSRIDYSAKYLHYQDTPQNPHMRWSNSSGRYVEVHGSWVKYTLSDDDRTGQGSSVACVTVTRPKDPPDEGGDPWSVGKSTTAPMFAGEVAPIGWDASAESYATRRLKKAQAMTFQVNVEYTDWENVTAKNTRYRGGDPSTYAASKHGTRYKVQVDRDFNGGINTNDGNGTEGDSGNYPQLTMMVPDETGDKYCNGFGYRYEYWYGYEDNGVIDWHHDSGRDYWAMYRSACSTIAKKPSTAIWNGSFMTAGGVKTSGSKRFDNPVMGDIANYSTQAWRQYRSWSEYLAVVGGKVQGFASAAATSYGSHVDDVYQNSNLTIANSTSLLGGSGIGTNSSFYTRLNAYLRRNATQITGSNFGGFTNTNSENFFYHNGNLNITGNIINATGDYANIYQLPQTVIFVDGNATINISSDVTQIDAWIIAPNATINTCAEFSPTHTESDADRHLRNTCTKQLVFNGPVIAKNMNLRRSYGSDPIIGWQRANVFNNTPSTRWAAGEIFNLRADTYLWAYAQAGRYDSSYTESYSRELAPRY